MKTFNRQYCDALTAEQACLVRKLRHDTLGRRVLLVAVQELVDTLRWQLETHVIQERIDRYTRES